jgi:glycosyltransferase involved in cell wall biosynthesis
VKVGNPGAIADAVDLLASDCELRATLAENARKHAVETYDIGVMLNAYEEIYQNITAR